MTLKWTYKPHDQDTNFANYAILIDELDQETDFLFATGELHRQVIILPYDCNIYVT